MSSPAPGKAGSVAQRAAEGRRTEPVRGSQSETLQAQAGNRAVSQLLGGGTPLSDSVRADMEARFGTSFSDVRIHTGPNAQTATSALGAAAFTHGQDVVFGHGGVAPESGAGKRLLAHELAHVVQQRRGGLAPAPGNASPTEIGAERAANDVVAGAGPVQVQGASAIGIAKSEEADGATDDSAIAPLLEGFRQRMVQLLVGASALGGPGPALLGKVIEGMSDQLYEELWVNGRGAKLFWNVLSLGPGELAKAGVTYQLGVIEGAVTPATDLFGMAVFAENVRNTLASLAVSTYNASDQIGPEIRALIASTSELTQAARDSVSAIVNDPDALNTLFSLPQATYALATRNAYDLGKTSGLKVMAALESPWTEEENATEAPKLGSSTVLSWIGSNVNALRKWGVVSPGAKIGEAVGFAMGMVAIQLLAMLATGGMSGALKGAGTAMAKVGTAVARISPRAGGAISQVGGLVTVLGSAANEINLAINALDDVAMAALKRFVGPLLDKLRVVLGSLQDLLGKIRDANKREALPAPRRSSEELARRSSGPDVDPADEVTELKIAPLRDEPDRGPGPGLKKRSADDTWDPDAPASTESEPGQPSGSTLVPPRAVDSPSGSAFDPDDEVTEMKVAPLRDEPDRGPGPGLRRRSVDDTWDPDAPASTTLVPENPSGPNTVPPSAIEPATGSSVGPDDVSDQRATPSPRPLPDPAPAPIEPAPGPVHPRAPDLLDRPDYEDVAWPANAPRRGPLVDPATPQELAHDRGPGGVRYADDPDFVDPSSSPGPRRPPPRYSPGSAAQDQRLGRVRYEDPPPPTPPNGPVVRDMSEEEMAARRQRIDAAQRPPRNAPDPNAPVVEIGADDGTERIPPEEMAMIIEDARMRLDWPEVVPHAELEKVPPPPVVNRRGREKRRRGGT